MHLLSASPTVPAIDEGIALIALAVTGLVAIVVVAVVWRLVRRSRRRNEVDPPPPD